MIALLLALAAQGFHLGGDQGIYSTAFNAGGVVASVTLDAPAYTRTVTASSYTLTGTSTGSGAVSWAASPSGASGACTGTDTFSCDVTVTPDATGEGVEVITVTRGAATDTETIGFYVAGAHSVFLAQNVDGTYNSSLTNLDAVATWQNVGTSALDVTQGTGAAQPTFRTSIVGGQPVVRCDGGDRVAAAAASDWTFLHNGTDWTVDSVGATVSGAGVYAATSSTNAAHGFALIDLTATYTLRVYNATPTANFNFGKAGHTAGLFHLSSVVLDDDGGAGADASIFVDALTVATAARASTYSATATPNPFGICAFSGTLSTALTGDLFRVLIYQSALTSTQRGINKAVDEWALGGTLPVTP